MDNAKASGQASEWRTVARQIQEYLRASSSAGFQDVSNLCRVLPRAHREAVQGCLNLVQNQIEALEGFHLNKTSPGARLVESFLSTQRYAMQTQAELLAGYLDLVDKGLDLLGGKES